MVKKVGTGASGDVVFARVDASQHVTLSPPADAAVDSGPPEVVIGVCGA